MNLSNELLSQFAKITKDTTETKTEKTVYGTVNIVKNPDGTTTTYVNLDGSNMQTPVSSTTDVKTGDRVTVMIKDHTAIITGNITAPSARNEVVQDINTKLNEKFDNLAANTITTDKLYAETARIENLVVDGYATIESLEALEAQIGELDVDNLDAKYATIENLESNYATIASLDAVTADVGALEADVADIDTLMFGSASGNTIQTTFSNAVIAQLGNAQIKSAMIDSLSADKITAGDIITNDVRVMSEDGSLIISDETMQISDENRVRVQIGKDASGDYSINIWDQNGNLMFSKGGITDSAIKDAIIRNDMVSDDANIAAHKLDIDSLFDEINDSTKTIKSTKVYLDDQSQTLDIAFQTMSSDVGDLQNGMTSQGTQITAIQGQISSKIWQQDINSAKSEMSTQYSTLNQELDNLSSTVASTKSTVDNLEIGSRNFAIGSDATFTASNSMIRIDLSDYGKNMLIPDTSVVISFDAYAGLNTALDCYIRGESGSISTMPVHSIGTEKKRYSCVVTMNGSDPQTVTFRSNTSVIGYVKTTVYVSNVKVELGNKPTDWTLAPEDVESRISSAETTIEQNTKDIALRATKSELVQNYYTKEQTKSEINIASDAIKSTVSATYATQSALSSVEQTATDLTIRFDGQKIGGRNLVLNSEAEVSFKNEVKSFNLSEYGIANLANTEVTVSFDLYTDEPGAGCDYYVRYIASDGSGKAVGITPINGVTGSYKRYSAVIATGDTPPTMFGIRSSQYTTGKPQSSTATFYIRRIKVEIGNMATDWTPAPEDVDSDISKAAKTATNYMKASGSGLVVGDMTVSTLGKNVLIDSDSVDIRNGSTVMASFGANTITLGQNAEGSTIDLCDGAGTIKAAISETQTSLPRYDSLALESQELTFSGRRIDMDVAYSNSTALKESSMTLMTGNSGIGSDYTITASGDKNQAGVSGAATENYVSTHYDIYAEHYDASANTWLSNSVSVYPLRTQFEKEITIMGNRVTGANNVLWTGGYYMTSDHSCTLSEGVNDQTNGIVLIFSEFRDGATVNNTWHQFFIPKKMVVSHGGAGHCFQMSTSNLAYYATKYLYISNTKITGHDNNSLTGASTCGITKTNNRFVLRYVIGV